MATNTQPFAIFHFLIVNAAIRLVFALSNAMKSIIVIIKILSLFLFHSEQRKWATQKSASYFTAVLEKPNVNANSPISIVCHH